MSKKETTGQAMTRSLVAHGIDTVFGIPGAHMYDFNDALYGARDQVRFIHTRHEQGAGYMAYGYAKSTGRIGAYTVVPGPGVLNSGAALCTAYGANAPVLCITGNIMSHLIGQGRGQLHELPDQLATMRGLTKTAVRINHPSEAGPVMAEVIGKMLSGRQGPGAVEAPWDVFGQSGPEVDLPLGKRAPHPAVNSDQIAAAAALISGASNPMIMVGGGAADAGAEIAALAELLQSPVTSHRSGKGIVADDHPNYLNFVAAYEYWQKTDVLIGIGSRLELQFMRWKWLPKDLKIIRIDIDPTEMVRLKPGVGIVADAKAGTQALIDALAGARREDRTREFADLNRDARSRFSEVQPQLAYLDAIRQALPRDGFFVEEVSQMGFTARFAFPVYGPRQYVTCGYQDNLGFGFNTALGVKVANPDKAVVSVSGDGGFMFGVQELATAVQHRIAVVAIVFNNSAYGNVLRDQKQAYHGRYLGSDLTNPDFVALAESFGIRAFKVISPVELKERIEQALSLDEPVLIEVPIEKGSEASPWPFIHPAPHAE
ncbi:thiamine pyrophosphate-dependent enzyme, possible carboligase or decarboxylase [Rhizobium leguminosarum bv. trifolii WSM597]|uniref:Thiamine pyrophosphate-dependent enzyme, possible carboligase or decarboxylase n=1 Tax=Rhizobium leguminosarum bv. trifolii WSM597 TaxID=754764 RepID=I9NHM4_RHILT|nr:thiamine pyrophosphate-dependent enzyme [Rhizobium leguminosarum]EJB06232.1 thiamine pyrophosphate-dependent enzyme, possible carboligase or decarboxylase [Rhizobium leguminosarum bv. trifolii WSM597]